MSSDRRDFHYCEGFAFARKHPFHKLFASACDDLRLYMDQEFQISGPNSRESNHFSFEFGPEV